MPLVPTKSSPPVTKPKPKPQPPQPEKQSISFMVSKPKYRLSDLILSESNLDELQTVIKAKEYWNKVFVDWNLQSVMKQRKSLSSTFTESREPERPWLPMQLPTLCTRK